MADYTPYTPDIPIGSLTPLSELPTCSHGHVHSNDMELSPFPDISESGDMLAASMPVRCYIYGEFQEGIYQQFYEDAWFTATSFLLIVRKDGQQQPYPPDPEHPISPYDMYVPTQFTEYSDPALGHRELPHTFGLEWIRANPNHIVGDPDTHIYTPPYSYYGYFSGVEWLGAYTPGTSFNIPVGSGGKITFTDDPWPGLVSDFYLGYQWGWSHEFFRALPVQEIATIFSVPPLTMSLFMMIFGAAFANPSLLKILRRKLKT